MDDNYEPQVYLTSAQVKRRYHISDATLWRWEGGAGDGFPMPMRVGRKKLYHLASLEAWEDK
jgi:hypothetical protein